MQVFLKSEVLSCEEIKTLTSFRSNCTRSIRSNFRKMFSSLECPLQCDILTPQIDNPSHILECKKLKSNTPKEDLSLIYGTSVEQETIAKVLCKLMRKRTMLLEQVDTSLPGVIPDSSPNTAATVLPCV